MLTDPDDLVIDIFSGSNTTGMVAEQEGRRWLAFEERRDYVAASAFRFLEEATSETQLKCLYETVLNRDSVDLTHMLKQPLLFA